MSRSKSDSPRPADWTAIVEPQGRPGHVNMAVDHALLCHAQEGAAFFRLYRWSPPCLSFGRNEPATRRYDRARIGARGIDVVRRPTGGRAVWHDQELTYAVAAPTAAVGGNLQQCYLRIHTVLADALGSLGVAASLAVRGRRTTPSPAGGACFASPVGGEVIVGGRKLVGSAQWEHGGAFLQHGSILFADTQDVVRDLARGPHPEIAATSLAALMGGRPSFEHVAAAILDAARRAFPGSWSERDGSTVATGGFNFVEPSWTWRK